MYYCYNLLLLLSLLVITCRSLIQEKGFIKQMTTVEEMRSALFKKDYLQTVLYCSSTQPKCKTATAEYEKFSKKVHDYINLYSLDCSILSDNDIVEFPACQSSKTEDLPVLVFFEPNQDPTANSSAHQHLYQGLLETSLLEEFGQSHLPDFSQKVSKKKELEAFLKDKLIANKVVFFNKEDELPFYYKALTSEFRDRIAMAEVTSNGKSLWKEHPEISSQGFIIFEKKEDGTYNKIVYKGMNIIRDLKKAIEPYALKEKVVRPKNEDGQIEFIKIKSKNFKEEIESREDMVLVHVFKDDDLFPAWNETVDKFKTLFKYYEFNCSRKSAQQFALETLKLDNYPSLLLYVVGEKDVSKPVATFLKFNNLVEILKEVSDHIPDKTKQLRSDEEKDFTYKTLLEKKAAVLLFHDSPEISMSYRAISQLKRFKNKLSFAHIKNPTKDTMESFGITGLPTLITMLSKTPLEGGQQVQPDDIRLARYKGRFVLHELITYFNSIIDGSVLGQEQTPEKVVKLNEQKDIANHCSQRTGYCLIALINGEESDNKKSIEILENVARNNPGINYGWIDANCHDEILLSTNIKLDETPAIFVYDIALGKFAKSQDYTFNENDIASFIKRFRNKEIELNQLNRNINLQKKDCKNKKKPVDIDL